MAPRKEKSEKATAEQGPEMILKYLRKQNRPYSAIDVSANLHNKVTKSAAAKHLKELHEKNEIAGCTSGKQVVYHAIQDPSIDASAETLATMNALLSDIRNETSSLEIESKTLKTQLAALGKMRSTAGLEKSMDDLASSKSNLLMRLEPLRNGQIEKIDGDENSKIEKELEIWKGAEGRRRKIVGEMWNLVSDCVGDTKDVNELKEELGLNEH